MSTFTHQNTSITFNADGTVNHVVYTATQPLLSVIATRLQGLQLTPGGVTLPAGLVSIIVELLDSIAAIPAAEAAKKVYLADHIFGHLIIDSPIPNPKLKVAISSEILRVVENWEATHEIVHKGTPYYFLAETYLAQGDIPSAYIYFFNALEQDRINFPTVGKNVRTGAAYLTTSLVDDINNALYNQVVVPLRTYLQSFITHYCLSTGSTLSLNSVDNRFLQHNDFEDIKRFFVASIHEIYHLAPLNSTHLINNDYSKLKISDTLFNLSLILDQILQKRFLAAATRYEKNMANAIYRLALQLTWTNNTADRDARTFIGHISPNLNSGTPDQILPSILDGTATFHGNVLTPQQKAVFLAYHLRNFGGHNIGTQDILVNRYGEILLTIMDAILTSIEVL
jgi:hypothetical protein